jgi:hypothetical protein
MLKNRSVTYVLGLLLPMSLIYTPRRHNAGYETFGETPQEAVGENRFILLDSRAVHG